jgi:MoxR-like ATPase
MQPNNAPVNQQPTQPPLPAQQPPYAQQPPPSGAYSTVFAPPKPAISEEDLVRATSVVREVSSLFRAKMVGQESMLMSLLVALLSNGHILLESVPGLAKTTGAKTLADAISASFRRIQCTPDLLPSDIIGTQIYNYSKGTFETQLGPVHANFVLLDEINRSSSKTQSAMLEAMQERQTTIGGEAYPLPKPFCVLATQNPIEQEGTYELPEAQMDRFLLKEVLTYPAAPEEIEILNRIESGVIDAGVDTSQVVSLEDVLYLQQLVKKVYVDASVKQYIVNIINASRYANTVINPELARYVEYGASPRGSITLLQVSRAIALINGRDYVTPDDVKLLRYSSLRHRIILNFEAIADNVHQEAIIDAIFTAITAP